MSVDEKPVPAATSTRASQIQQTNDTPTANHFQHTQQSLVFRVGGQEKVNDAPSGNNYLARCVHIEPDWGHIGSKIALYFIIELGQYKGYRARLFYRKRTEEYAEENGSYFGSRSKFMKDIRRIFPEMDFSKPINIDLGKLFLNRVFKIDVVQKLPKDGTAANSIVTKIEHPDLAES